MKFSNSNSQSKTSSSSKVKVMLILFAIQAQIFISILTSPQVYADGGGSGFSVDCPCMLPGPSGIPCQIDIPDGDPPNPDSNSTAQCCVDGVEVYPGGTCNITPPPSEGNKNIGNDVENKTEIDNECMSGPPGYPCYDYELRYNFRVESKNITAESETVPDPNSDKTCTSPCGRASTNPEKDSGGNINLSGSFTIRYGPFSLGISASKNQPKKEPQMCSKNADVPFYTASSKFL